MSCHILPLSNTNYNDGHSQYQEDDIESVIEDDDDEIEPPPAKPIKFKDTDPEVINAKLLQKHAEMQGVAPSGELLVSNHRG